MGNLEVTPFRPPFFLDRSRRGAPRAPQRAKSRDVFLPPDIRPPKKWRSGDRANGVELSPSGGPRPRSIAWTPLSLVLRGERGRDVKGIKV